MTVRDANGLVMQASTNLQLPFPVQPVWSADTPGVAVGGEFNVYEWGCVQESSAGFRDVFNGAGVPIDFRWNAPNAWERDFKQTGAPTDGDDAAYVDDVDLAWYTGHGGPAVHFRQSRARRRRITPSDARYGDHDLEWLQLESCQVLASPSGGGTNAVDRGAAYSTACTCSTGSTRMRRAEQHRGHLRGVPLRAARPEVRQAWAQMANDLEPSGVSIVHMGPIRTGDFVLELRRSLLGPGLRSGPDIPASQTIGLWWLKSTV